MVKVREKSELEKKMEEKVSVLSGAARKLFKEEIYSAPGWCFSVFADKKDREIRLFVSCLFNLIEVHDPAYLSKGLDLARRFEEIYKREWVVEKKYSEKIG